MMRLSELNNKKSLRFKSGAFRVPFTCEITFTNDEGVEETRQGRTFEIEPGLRLDLFPIGVLCRMLGRQHRAIYRWEKDHGFPAAMWRIQEMPGCNRWYSRKQLIAITSAYGHYGRLRKKNRTKLKEFIGVVRTFFHTIDMPTENR